MSTMQQQAPPAEAVEEQMGKIVTELGAALGVLLTSLGTRSGLWAALAGAGPLTTAEVAGKVSVEPSLVREWRGTPCQDWAGAPRTSRSPAKLPADGNPVFLFARRTRHLDIELTQASSETTGDAGRPGTR